ncbi:uncharacterized protein LOC117338963 [Pecten maximus]|uniref:uncharacterized protein LOC117338963 n=1 Tax=Pecten maximus TaxID=6579 RepID=UPI001458224B|nr:uncharacterized protein LOC117338963 [Pecten maximus]
MNYDILQYFQCKVEDVSNALNFGGYWFDNLVPGLNVTQCLHQDSEIPYYVFDITIFFPVAWNEDMKHRIITTGEALMRQAMMQYYISGSFRIISISEIGRMKRQTSGNFSSGGFVAECEIKVASASAVTVQSVTNNITGVIYNRNSSSVFYGATVQVAKKKDEPGPLAQFSPISSNIFAQFAMT